MENMNGKWIVYPYNEKMYTPEKKECRKNGRKIALKIENPYL